MIRPELTRIAAKVRARLKSGAALTWRDVWAMAPDASRTWAHDTLRKAGRAACKARRCRPTDGGRAWMCRARPT